jgi:hypothetical protein
MTNDDGVTLRDRLLQVYNSTGQYDSRLDLPTIPVELEYIMGWFWDIRNAVGGNGFGTNPISFSEIMSWCKLNDIQLTPWEVSVIRKLDTEYVNIVNKSLNDKNRSLMSKGTKKRA